MYRRNQTESMILIWIPVVVFSILLLSCGNLQELIGLKEEEDSLPKEVIESAKGFFELTHTKRLKSTAILGFQVPLRKNPPL